MNPYEMDPRIERWLVLGWVLLILVALGLAYASGLGWNPLGDRGAA